MDTEKTIVYEKDYTYIYDEDREENVESERFWQAMADEGIMEAISEYRDSKPRIINPIVKTLFEYMIPKADSFAEDFGGTIKAYIDYRLYEAKIDLILPFMQLRAESEIKFMLTAIATSMDVEIYPAEQENCILFRMNFPYFATLDNPAEDAEIEAKLSAQVRELNAKLQEIKGQINPDVAKE